MPINWGPEKDAKFFMAVLKIHPITLNWVELAKELSVTMDQEVTMSALQNRMNKIRAMNKTSGGSANASPTKSNANGSASSFTAANAPSTPTKRAPGATKKGIARRPAKAGKNDAKGGKGGAAKRGAETLLHENGGHDEETGSAEVGADQGDGEGPARKRVKSEGEGEHYGA